MKSVNVFLKTSRYLILIIFLCGTVSVNAGKHPYQPLGHEISHTVIEILKKHGMAAYHDRVCPWFYYSSGSDSWIGGTPLIELYFYKGHEIPLEAQMEIIQYCMKLHESRGRKEIIRILIRDESFNYRVSKPKPYFELSLNAIK
jgi:hypothetical protein